jgi:3-phenylpropionate/trans-cinnamate dioxygenase ferredoxin reductase component
VSQHTQQLRSVVVVGASIAGLRAVESLRLHGFDGLLTLIGAESHLPYDRPPLSKEYLAGEWDDARITLTTREQLDEAADTKLGERVERLDLPGRKVALASGDEVGFDGLVIATGAKPRHLPELERLDGVVTIRRVEDADDLRRRLSGHRTRLVVVGGGFLGMEVAATARGLGAEVTVVEPLSTPLARVLGPEIGAAIADMHREHGVDVRTEMGVEAVVGEERVEAVVLSDKSELSADVVLVAIGVAPDTSWLEDSGLELADGVVCAASLICAPGVVAAGDLARFPHPLSNKPVRFEHRTSAAEQGVHAALSLLAGEAALPFTTVPYFWSDQFGTKFQSIGIPEPTDDIVIVAGSLRERRFVACFGRAGQLSAAVGASMPRDLMRFYPLLTRNASLDEALVLARGEIKS